MGLFAMSLLRSATRVVLFRRGGSAVCLSPRVGLSLLQSDSPFSGHGLNTRSPFMRQQALISTAKPPSMKPRDTKAAFQQGNVEETITRWEREARVAELNLITEKLGLDRKKYKDISVQMGDIIALRTKLMGNKHPETIYSNAILAAIYRVVGKFTSASNIIKQCVSISEEMILDYKSSDQFSKKDLYMLYASCVEEYARIHLQMKDVDTALSALRQALSVIESQATDETSATDYAVHLALLQRLAAECYFELNSYVNAKEALTNSETARTRIPDGTRLRFYLLNHWVSEAHSIFENHLLQTKIYSRLSEWESAEEELQSAWKTAVDNQGQNSVECCNAFLELLDFYSDLIPSRISPEEYQRLLKRALFVGRSTDNILRKTRGLDKRIVFPYLPMIQRGLRTLLPFDSQRGLCITLLFEQLRVQEKYPAIYPSTDEDVFTTVMSLVQLLREEGQYQEAYDLITKFKEQFESLKEKNADYVVPLMEVQAQLIISLCYGHVDSANPQPGNVPLGQQMKLTTQTREAVEALEYVTDYYLRKKNTAGAVRSLHTLSIVQTLQEEYSYADRDCFRCIKLLDPSFTEYASRIDLNAKNMPLSQVGRLSDLLILRGSLLRVIHEPDRAIQYYKTALQLLSISREGLTDNAALRINDEISRTSDILRCLECMMDITESTLSEYNDTGAQDKAQEAQKFLQSCKSNHESAINELNRLHARLQKTTQKSAN